MDRVKMEEMRCIAVLREQMSDRVERKALKRFGHVKCMTEE